MTDEYVSGAGSFSSVGLVRFYFYLLFVLAVKILRVQGLLQEPQHKARASWVSEILRYLKEAKCLPMIFPRLIRKLSQDRTAGILQKQACFFLPKRAHNMSTGVAQWLEEGWRCLPATERLRYRNSVLSSFEEIPPKDHNQRQSRR